MMQNVFAVMAGLQCALLGFRRAGFLRRESHRLAGWCSTLERLSLLLAESGLSLPDAFRNAACSGNAPDKLLTAISDDMKRTPLLTASEAFTRLAGNCTEYDVLLQLMNRLGHGSLESRQLAVSQAAAQLRLMSQQASDTVRKDANLCQTLGLAMGAALTILLL